MDGSTCLPSVRACFASSRCWFGRFGSDPVAITITSAASSPKRLRSRCHTKPEIDSPIGHSRFKIACNLANDFVLGLLCCEADLPPQHWLALNRATLWPRLAAISATFNPAGPPPTTTTRRAALARATRRSLTSRSRPAPGLWIHRIAFS